MGRITRNDLIVSFGELERESLLSSWRWLIGDGKSPVLVTVKGDAFVQDKKDGSSLLLSVRPGTIEWVADNMEEFREVLSDPDFLMEHFVPGLVADLRARGCCLDDACWLQVVPL